LTQNRWGQDRQIWEAVVPHGSQKTQLALVAKRNAAEWYEAIAEAATDRDVRTLAVEFALEERLHVLALERFLGRRPY